MSRAQRVIAAVCGRPWAILPEKLEAITELLALRAEGIRFTQAEIRERIGAAAATKPPAGPRGIAVLPLFGVLAQRMGMMEQISGGTSTETFGAWFDQAMGDAGISAIVLNVDSPGGEVFGVQELASKILAARGQKPIVAVANSLAASAAYWIASAADEVVVTPSGMVGSIGVIMTHLETSRANEQLGFTFTVLSAGKYKAEGNPYEPLSAEAKASHQDLLDTYYGEFVRGVAKGRSVSAEQVRTGYGQGRVLPAKEAVREGLADRIATLEETLARLGGRRGAAAIAPAATLAALEGGSLIPVEVTTGVAAWPPIQVTLPTGSLTQPPLHAGPTRVPFPDPAPEEAKEKPMSAPVAPTPTAGADPELQQMRAELKRRDDLAALKAAHPKYADRIEAAIPAGTSVQAVKDEILADMRAKLEAPPVVRVGDPNPTGALPNEATRPFASFGEQMVAIVQAGRPGGRRDIRLDHVNGKAIRAAASGMNESVSSEGGFFIQPELLPGVIDPVYADDPILSRVTRIPLSGNSVRYNVVDETSRVNGSRWGGIQMYWAGEADTATAKKPKLRQMQLALKKIIGIGYVTEELMEDAPAAEALLTRAFQTELRFMLADAIFRGSGAGQPQGFLTSGAVVSQAIEATQTIANSNTFIATNVSKMLTRIPASLWGEVIWLYQQELLPTLITAVIGSSAVPVFIGAGGLTDRPSDSILGRPAYGSELCEAVGTPGDLIAIAPSQYHIADKGGPQAATSVHVRFLYDEQTLRITYRTDGQPVWTTAITPYKGANSRSFVATLATRS